MSAIYIDKRGEILKGPKADEARLEAKTQELISRLPPPVYPVTLRLPPQANDAHLTTESQSADPNETETSDTDDDEFSDDECDGHRTLNQCTAAEPGSPGEEGQREEDSVQPQDPPTQDPATQTEAESAKPNTFRGGVKGMKCKINEEERKMTKSERKVEVSATATGIDAEINSTNAVGARNEVSATLNAKGPVLKHKQ